MNYSKRNIFQLVLYKFNLGDGGSRWNRNRQELSGRVLCLVLDGDGLGATLLSFLYQSLFFQSTTKFSA